MAATMLGSLLVSLGLESGEFKSGLAAAEKEMNRAARRIEATGRKMQRVGQNLSIAVTAPLTALGVASFKAATDVAEMEAAFDTVFGNLSQSVRDWAKTTAEELGRSRYEIQQSALSFQELFGKALDPAAAAEMSKQFAVLTQDLASFKNLSEDVAQQKLFSGLVGEAEPLRAVGVFLSEARVKAEAAKQGIEGVNGALTDQQKITLRAAIIQQDLAAAQGDVLRTSDGTANRLRAAQAAFTDLRVEIGQKLIPALTPLITALTNVLQAFNKLPEGVQTTIVTVGALAAALGPLLFVMGNVVTVTAPLVAGLKAVAAMAISTGTASGALTVALAGLRGALISLIATLGPYAIAIGVVVGAVYLLTRRTNEAGKASAEYSQRQRQLEEVQRRVTDATNQLAVATGEARKQALANAEAAREEAKQYLAVAQAAVIAAQAKLQEARASNLRDLKTASRTVRGAGGGIDPIVTQGRVNKNRTAKATIELGLAEMQYVKAMNELLRINSAIKAPPPVASLPGVSSGSGGGSGGSVSTGPTGPSAEEIEERFQDELYNYNQQALSARQSLAMSAEERADLELQSVEMARKRTLELIEADEDYSEAQKAELAAAVDRVATYERWNIELQKRAALEQQAADLARIEFDNQREILNVSYDLADTEAERKRLALEILALEQEYKRSTLERILASQTAADAEKAQARALLDGLDAIEAMEREAVARANETTTERYVRDLQKSPEQINEAIDSIKINGLEALNDALVDAIVNFKSLADVARNVVRQVLAELLRLQIQQAIIKPLAQAIGLPGFANGTNFAPGGLAIVGERGPELVNLPRGSQVIPNHELGSLGGGGNNMTFNLYGVTDARAGREAAGQIAMRMRRTLNG